MKMNKISRISQMWRKLKSVATALSLALIFLLAGLCASQAAEAKWIPGRLIVKPKPGVSTTALQGFNKTMGVTSTRILQAADNDWQVIEFNPLEDVQVKAKEFIKSGLVLYAEPDYIRTINKEPNDPAFAEPDNSYSFRVTHATTAWDVITDAVKTRVVSTPDGVQTNKTEILVAVIDTGVNYEHEDLVDNMWVNPFPTFGDIHGIRIANGLKSGDPMDSDGHGTHVAGTIGARGDNGIGTAGVCWNVKIMACRVLDMGASSDIVEGVAYARLRGANVMNMSLGSTAGQAAFSQIELAEFKRCRDAGILLVLAAGNETNDTDIYPSFPANLGTYLDNVISVGSSDVNDNPSSFSNYGRFSVDLFAPGSYIFSTWSDGGYNTISGTSMASPFVCGSAALCMAAHPDENYLQIKNRILSTVDKVPALSKLCATGGRINVANAIMTQSSYEGFSYSLLDETAVITGYSSTNVNPVIPDMIDKAKVVAIAESAFAKSESIESITLGQNITSIGASAFEACSNLKRVTFNTNEALKIGNRAFALCTSLETITLPATFTTPLGSEWILGCSALNAIEVEAGNPVYSSMDGILFSQDGKKLFVFPQGKADTEYTLPESVTTICEYAFAYSKLTALDLVKVLRVDQKAFWASDKLASVSFGLNFTALGENAFNGCTALASLIFNCNAPAATDESLMGVPDTAIVYYPAAATGWVLDKDGNWHGIKAEKMEIPTELAYSQEGSDLVLTYTGALYSSPDGKTWTKVSGAKSPFKGVFNSTMRFYRADAE